jgi:hypothetical protein
MVVDCCTPVEAGLLRQWAGEHPQEGHLLPYPVFDLSTLLLATRSNPTGIYPRITGETPVHNPLCDARQSGRLWVGALKQLAVVGQGMV